MHGTCLMTRGDISVQAKGEFSMGLKCMISGVAQSRDWAKSESKNPSTYGVSVEASDTTVSTCC